MGSFEFERGILLAIFSRDLALSLFFLTERDGDRQLRLGVGGESTQTTAHNAIYMKNPPPGKQTPGGGPPAPAGLSRGPVFNINTEHYAQL